MLTNSKTPSPFKSVSTAPSAFTTSSNAPNCTSCHSSPSSSASTTKMPPFVTPGSNFSTTNQSEGTKLDIATCSRKAFGSTAQPPSFTTSNGTPTTSSKLSATSSCPSTWKTLKSFHRNFKNLISFLTFSFTFLGGILRG